MRRLGIAALALLIAATLAGAAAAQTAPFPAPTRFPTKAVRVIVPYAPGGATDLLTRVIAQDLAQSFGQPFVVDNRAGAGGIVGLNLLATSPADGYTIGVGAANTLAIDPTLHTSLPYDTERDFAAVGLLAVVPLVLVVSPKVPAHSLKELVEILKAHPNEYSYGSPGVGNSAHLFGALFNREAGVKMVHVPYKSGGQVVQAMASGELQLSFSTVIHPLQMIQAGELRAIAMGAPERLALLPDVPTFAELGYSGFDSPTWFGVIAPARAPGDAVATLNRAIGQTLAKPDIQARLRQLGLEPHAMAPQAFGAFIAAERRKWAPIVRESGAKVE
jgi:tripartite-type tricarboxylate transporter receptor subunit TctC